MTDAVREAREAVLFTMRYGNWPSDTSVGDKDAERRFANCDRQNAEELDALLAARDAEWREAVERVRMLHSASCLRWIRNDDSQPCSCDDTTKIHNAALDALLLAMQKGGA